MAVASQAFGPGTTVTDQFGNPSLVANSFFSRYLLGFEATSILLLVAAVGARRARLQAAQPAGRRA